VIASFELDFYDKLQHFIAYFVFGICLQWAMIDMFQNLSKRLINYIFILIVIIFSIGDEFHQSFIPGRSADLFDVLADIAGAFVSFLFYSKLESVAEFVKLKFLK